MPDSDPVEERSGARGSAPQPELRHLRYFVALAEERNFERAALRLGIAQPGLSQQILKLEAILGAQLLDRRRRSVHLTASGELLLEDARKILAHTEATLEALKRVERGETGEIAIGYVASAAYSGTLIQSLSSFRRLYPDVKLNLIEMEMSQQLNRISEGMLDFGYIRPPVPVPEGVTTSRLLSEAFVVALPEAHEHAADQRLELTVLADEIFIVPRQRADIGFHRNTISACREAGFEPRIDASGRDFTTIASMVAVGLGIALVPRSLECLRLPGVRYVSLLDNRMTSDLAVAYRKTERSPAVKAFVAHTRRLSG